MGKRIQTSSSAKEIGRNKPKRKMKKINQKKGNKTWGKVRRGLWKMEEMEGWYKDGTTGRIKCLSSSDVTPRLTLILLATIRRKYMDGSNTR